MNEPRTPQAEREALEQLVACVGWGIVKEMVDAAYGARQQLAQIDAVMTKLKPGDSELAVVTQIRASGKAAFDVIARVEHRLQLLKEADAKKDAGPFGSFRRGPRSRGIPV